MDLYTRIAAVNVCIARSTGVNFDQAVAIAGETIAQVIQGQHGSVITVLGKQPLSLEELRRGALNSAVLGATEICPQQVPPDVLRNVEAALERAAPQPTRAKPAPTPATPAR
ncbi:MAG: cAMP phosphodiesterase [Cyanobacteriota bacterium]|nr:cAMP phosphodiesterase [Cyanobacteriota bacterium]